MFPSLLRPADSCRSAPFRLGAIALLLALTGCASVPSGTGKVEQTVAPMPAAPAPAAKAEPAPVAAPLPGVELTPTILYQLLIAEIAAQRDQLPAAIATYADLARNTRDPRIVRRGAELALFARQNDVVLELGRMWVELEPESMRARQMLAGSLVGAGKFDEAEPHMLALLKRDTAHGGELLLRMARAVVASPQRKELSGLLERLAATQGDKPEAHFVRALSAQSMGDKARALEEVDRVLVLRPVWEQAVLFRAQLLQETGRMAEAMESLKGFLERYPAARDVRTQYARALASGRDYEAARREYALLEKEVPESPEVIHAMAILSIQTGDLDGAEQRFRALLGMGVGNANALRMALGQLEEGRGRAENAMTWYQAITPGDQFLTARMRYAGLLQSRKGLDAALAYLKEVKADNESDRAQLLLGQAQLLRNASREKEAYALLEKALKTWPDQTDILYESALMGEKLGHKGVVEKNLRRLIKLKPDHAHAYNALGYTLAERGERLDEALQLITRATELAPGDPFILDSLGWVHFRKGNLETARQKLSEALGIRPDPEIAAHLGEVLWKLGRLDEAKATWQAAARLAPENEALLSTMKKFLPAAK